MYMFSKFSARLALEMQEQKYRLLSDCRFFTRFFHSVFLSGEKRSRSIEKNLFTFLESSFARRIFRFFDSYADYRDCITALIKFRFISALPLDQSLYSTHTFSTMAWVGVRVAPEFDTLATRNFQGSAFGISSLPLRARIRRRRQSAELLKGGR